MKRGVAIPMLIVAFVMMMMAMMSCSTEKNTAKTRWWHAFTAKYNIYYNGTLAYIDGSLEKERANKDNYTELLPLYTVGNKSSKEIGKSNFDRAIEKCQKTIKLHSITKRPEWTKDKKKTERDIEWLNRKEYNPFLWKAWMLMGRSQFHKGAFDDAMSTFSYMCHLYRTQPVIYGKARAWLAKCYIEQGWIYDAEDVIRNMQRDSIDWRAQKEWDYTYADYYLHNNDLDNAAKYLRKVIKHEMRSRQRAREYFLLGQIEAARGNRKDAYKAFRKVISQNPPYEMAFNARIAMTEVLANGGQAKAMIGRLKRMASNENNKDYLDQVYYALGNIYLAQKDTANAIAAYEKGNEKATRSGIEKGVLLLHLGDIYWAKEKFSDAGRCYGEAIGLLDKDREDYKQLAERSKVLDELVPFTDAVYMQDSLQSLARMDEKQRNEAIDRVITALKKKEKEEKERAQAEEAERMQAKNGTGQRQRTSNSQTNTGNKSSAWYFYSPTAVQQGKQAFEKQWGKRKNEDNWQRANRTVVGSFDEFAENTDSVANDSIPDEAEDIVKKKKKDKEKEDSAAFDPHKREYYLAQIPFTPEQIEESNEIIKDGLFHSGIIFKDKLGNLALSEKAFKRLTRDFPDFEPMDEVYYHQFLLYSRLDNKAEAEQNVENLKKRYPESKWTILLTDPYFEENAKVGKHMEDSLYAATYNAFLDDKFDVVKQNTKISDSRFVMGENRDKFLFISGLSMLNEGNADGCLKRMQEVVQGFPESKVSEMAGMIIKGVQEGKKLHGAKFSMSDVWNRRTAVMADSDSIAARKFNDERDIPFTFMLVYQPDSVKENQLLYQLARFNFTNFMVRNFDIELNDAEGLHRMEVRGFRSFDEARQYARVLYSNDAMKVVAQKCRPIVISDNNVSMLGTQYSYNDYDTFYVEHFQSLDIEREYMLYEPDLWDEKMERSRKEITPILPSKTADPDGVAPVSQKSENEEEDDEDSIDDSFAIPEGDNVIGADEETTIEESSAEDKGAESTVSDIQVKDESQEQADDDAVVVDDANKEEGTNADDAIVIGTGDDGNAGTDDADDADDVIIVGDDDNSTNESDDEVIVVADDDKSGGEVADDEVIIVEDTKKTETKKTDTKKASKEQQKDEKKKETKNSSEDDEDDDDREDSLELEDEYYELEGF